MEAFYWQLLDDLWHKLRQENTALSGIVLALHHHRILSSLPPWHPPSLTLKTKHVPLLLPQLLSHFSCHSCNSRKYKWFGSWQRNWRQALPMNRIPPLWLYPGWNPSCSPTSADTVSLSFVFYFCPKWAENRSLFSTPSTWEDRKKPVSSMSHISWHQRNPTPLLAVVFLGGIRCSGKQGISFVGSNRLMTSQSILPYSFIRNCENACYLLRPDYCRWWVCLFSVWEVIDQNIYSKVRMLIVSSCWDLWLYWANLKQKLLKSGQ